CGEAPSRASGKCDSVIVSWSKLDLSTIRPPKSDSPSPGLSTTASIAAEYDDRAPAGVSAPDAEEGTLPARRLAVAACTHGAPAARAHREGAVCRAACPLVVLVPRRGLAAGGARSAGGRARLPGARVDRPRRRLR